MISEISLFFITYTIIKMIVWIRKRFEVHKRFSRRGIKGPKPSFFSGNMYELIEGEIPHKVIDNWIERYGNCFGYFIGEMPHLVINDLDSIHQILVKNNKVFTDRPSMFIAAKPFIDSLIGVSGERWRRVRRVVTPTFSHRCVTSAHMSDTIANCVRIFMSQVERQRESAECPVIDVGDRLQAITLDIICRTALNMNDNTVQNPNDSLMKAVKEFMENANNIAVTAAICFPFLRSVFTFINNYLTSGHMIDLMVNQLKKQIINQSSKPLPASIDDYESRYSLLDSLLICLRRQQITNDELIGNAHLVMMAGYETTSTGLTFALYLLAKHQHIQNRLREQILLDGIKCQYLNMVWLESIRLYPPVISFVSRVSSKDCIINDIFIEKDTVVVVPVWHIHHDNNIWPNAFDFDPQRFAPENKHNIPQSAFLTFGSGPRSCIGMQFAEHVAKLVLITVLTKYKLEMCDKTPEVLTLRCPTVIINPSQPIFLKFVPIS